MILLFQYLSSNISSKNIMGDTIIKQKVIHTRGLPNSNMMRSDMAKENK